jgi:hypothetical protein
MSRKMFTLSFFLRAIATSKLSAQYMVTKRLRILLGFCLLGIVCCEAASISGPTNVVANCTVTYNVSGCSGGPIFWSGPSAMQVLSGGNGNSYITVRFLSAGSYGIFVGGGCTTSLNVTVSDNPTVAISGPAVVCHGTMRTYSVPIGTACTWSVVSGSTLVQSTTTTGTGNINFNITWKSNASGNAKISVTRTHTSGCQATGFYDITVENGVGTISGPSPANSGFTYTYTAGSGSNHFWTANGGQLIDPQGFSTMRIKWNCNIASGSVSVTYNSNAGCSKFASMPVSLTPVTPTLTPVDGYSANEYCYKAARTFVTEPGYSTYNWTVTGMRENQSNPFINPPSTHTYNVSKPSSDPNRHTLTMDASTSGFLYGSVTIKVRYDLGGGCNSSEKTQVMTVTPASIAFRSSTTAVPIVCYSDSQNVGDYSTDGGFTNYSWTTGDVTNVGKGVATNPNAQTTNINWMNPTTITTGLTGGTVPVIVTYSKNALNCTNTNLARNGVNIRNPGIVGATQPPPINTVGQTVLFSSSNSDGYEWSWAIDRPELGRFTDQYGASIPPPTNSATYITWDQNDEPGSHPIVSVNYWLYYPQVNGTRISYCTGASKQVDIRACSTCGSRQASDVASNNYELVEPGILQVYPTPADNELWIHNVPIGSVIKMISVNGAETISAIQDQESMVKRIETSSLGSGVYLLRTVNIDNQPVSLRVIIRH